MATKPELFIIESLNLEDEEQGRQEGEILARMLNLSGKIHTKYYYIRTERELDEIFTLFDSSNYRYLHISCHANKRNMETTFDSIPYTSLGEKLKERLAGKRVFVSACEMANDVLARNILGNTKCLSLIGPAARINFDTSAAFWITFYHLMFKLDGRRMMNRDVDFYVRELSALFGEPINYFRPDEAAAKGYRRTKKAVKTTGT